MSDTLFTKQSLTAAINNQSLAPSAIAASGLFNEQGIRTTTVQLDLSERFVKLVAAVPRGGVAVAQQSRQRKGSTFAIPHLPTYSKLLADEVQNVRVFGSDNELESIENRRDQELSDMADSINYTIENHRAVAISGHFMDNNGTKTSLFSALGESQTVVSMKLNTASTKIKSLLNQAKNASVRNLGSPVNQGFQVWCGTSFFEGFTGHGNVEKFYLNNAGAASLRGDTSDSFSFGGALWHQYLNGDDVGIPDDEAYLVPNGIRNLFITRFGPADYTETVNTIGLPYYASAEELPHNKGFDLEAQSNSLNICTRPQAIIKLTLA